MYVFVCYIQILQFSDFAHIFGASLSKLSPYSMTSEFYLHSSLDSNTRAIYRTQEH
jgi:hypothetical protein